MSILENRVEKSGIKTQKKAELKKQNTANNTDAVLADVTRGVQGVMRTRCYL